jgi:hypothetical protein
VAVIFLGAGASYDLGLPLTADLLGRIIGAAADGTLFGDDNAARECILEALKTLFPGWAERPHGEDSKAVGVQLPPITDLLSTIDFLLQSGTAPAPDFDLEKLARARHLFERAIFEQLARVEDPDALAMEGVPDAVRDEWYNAYVRKVMTGRTTGTPTRARAVDYILSLSREEPVTLLSTNYDIEIEQELYARLGYRAVFENVDFGTPVRDPATGWIHPRPANARFAVYKLHGSLDWLACPACDSLYLNPIGAIAYLSFLLGPDRPKDQWLQELHEQGANQCHCEYRPLRHVIVAPSFVRNVQDPNLLSVWRSALAALRRAGRWILVGYSLPPEDVAIRTLLLRGFRARDHDRKLAVVVVQKGVDAQARYRMMFPHLTAYHPDGFAAFLASEADGAAVPV